MADLKRTIPIYNDNGTQIDALSQLGDNSMFFTGVDNQLDNYFDPIVTGYAFIYWVNLPTWFDKDPDLSKFKQLSQRNFRSFNGVSGLELGTAQLNTGFANNELNVVTGITRGNTEFTIGHKEFSGSPMTKMYQKWISLIRDPRTGIATYPKLYNVDYGARNHSGQLLYIVTRPDVTNVGHNNIEYAAFYSNVVPTNVPLDTLYNFEIGSQDSPTIEINFKGFPEIGPHVTDYAKKILDDKIMNTKSESYMPFVDMYNTNTEASKHVNWAETPLSEIYGETDEN